MTINVEIGDEASAPEPITIKIGSETEPTLLTQPPPEPKIQKTVSLNIRKSLDGNLMIFDHEELDIVVMPTKNKVVAFPKDEITDTTYPAQDRLFFHLVKKGVIEPSSVHGGNVYGSIEGKIASSYDGSADPLEMTVLIIGNFVEEEAPYFSLFRKQDKQHIEDLTNPDDEDSTELGDVPHQEKKGSLRPGYIRGPYGMTSFYRY
tara:strand:+ start:731 stop:1345 length:615 start_codon:yes stop_codon:yes gene_type:complete